MILPIAYTSSATTTALTSGKPPLDAPAYTSSATTTALTSGKPPLDAPAYTSSATATAAVSKSNTSSPAAILDIPPSTQEVLYLQNSGAWQSIVRARNYLAATCYSSQQPVQNTGLLFDTVLIKIGSDITANNTASSTVFLLAPGFTYKCTAEIFMTNAGIMYQWTHKNVQFGITGYGTNSGTVAAPAVGFITNNGDTLMAVTVTLSPLLTKSIAPIQGNAQYAMGPLVIIESIS